MSTKRKHYKSNKNPFKVLASIVVVSLILILLVNVVFNENFVSRISKSNAEGNSFTFTAAGDFGQDDVGTAGVMNGMASTNASFALALGDFSYRAPGTESEWCSYVKTFFGQDYPFQLIAGNHDVGSQGIYNNFLTCLPNRMSLITGEYGKQYYFDYNNLARFVLISPDIAFSEGEMIYSVGSTNYNWLSNAIDDARADGIKWVIVGMHKNCITTGTKSCTIGPEIMDLLISKKVDLILQGHDHTYQRSKQLAFSLNCSSLVPNVFNPNCVADDGSDFEYIKGKGSVLIINGLGGAETYEINQNDSEAGYFANFIGGTEASESYGYLKFDVNENQIIGRFISTNGNTFSDYFTISIPATPTLTPTKTPIPTPASQLKTLNLKPTADSFVREDQLTKNFGKVTYLQTDYSPRINSFIRFDLRSLAGKEIVSARLLLKVNDAAGPVQTLRRVDDKSWSDSSLTWSNKPAFVSKISDFYAKPLNSVISLDIKGTVNNKKGNYLNLGITTLSETDIARFYSKESSPSNSPKLVIEYR